MCICFGLLDLSAFLLLVAGCISLRFYFAVSKKRVEIVQLQRCRVTFVFPVRQARLANSRHIVSSFFFRGSRISFALFPCTYGCTIAPWFFLSCFRRLSTTGTILA